MRVLFLDIKLEIELNTPLDFSSMILVFQTPSEMSIKGIRADMLNLWLYGVCLKALWI